MSRGVDGDRGSSLRERTREALISATMSLVEEKGFAALRVAEIARRAGMSTGAIYSAFEDRDDLVKSALLSNIEDFAGQVVSNLADAVALSPTPEGIRRGFAAQLDAMFTSKRQVRRTRRVVALVSSSGDSDVARRLDGVYGRLTAEVESSILAGVKAGAFTPGPYLPVPAIAKLVTVVPHGLEVVLGTVENWDNSPVIAEVHRMFRDSMHMEPPESRGRNAGPPLIPLPASSAVRRFSASRSRVLEATRHLIAEHGFQKVRITEVAERANLSTGAIYGNFTNRHDMVCQALLEDYYDGIRQDTAALLSELGTARASEPALTAIRGMFSSKAVPRLMRRMEAFVASTSEPGVARALRETQEGLVADLAIAISKGLDAGLLTNRLRLSPVTIAYITAALPLGALLAIGPDAEWETNDTVQSCADFLRVMVGLDGF